MQLLGISGSLRAGSFNTALLRAAGRQVEPWADWTLATLHGIPLYDGDDEARNGLPEAVVRLRERVAAADGLVLATPEYNNGVPGVFKNAIDWLSRTSASYPNVLQGKPVALVGASPGGFGTVSAQGHWLPVLRALGMPVWPGPRLAVSRADTLMRDGELDDAATLTQLGAFLRGFGDFVAAQARRG